MPRVQVPLKKADARSRVEQTRPPIVRRHRNRDRVAPEGSDQHQSTPCRLGSFSAVGRDRVPLRARRPTAAADWPWQTPASHPARLLTHDPSARPAAGGTSVMIVEAPEVCAPAKTDRLNITPLHSLPRASLQVTKARWQFNGPGLRASTYAVPTPPMACGAWSTPWRSMASNDEWRCLYSPNAKRLRVSGRAWPRLGEGRELECMTGKQGKLLEAENETLGEEVWD